MAKRLDITPLTFTEGQFFTDLMSDLVIVLPECAMLSLLDTMLGLHDV